jgi:hypothetical protein
MDRFDVSRRAFVAGAATIVAAVAPIAVSAADAVPAVPAPPAGYDDVVPFAFDRVAFAAVLNTPFDHRQVLTAKSFRDARDGLNLMRNSIQAYTDPKYFAGGPNALHAAAVWYHGDSVLLGLDDAMFAKYPLAAGIVQFATGKAGIDKDAKTNPGAKFLGELVNEHHASFFVCNNALSGMAAFVATQIATPANPVTRASVVAIHDEFVAHFLPGVSLVPAGVAAINAAQESHFTLLVN